MALKEDVECILDEDCPECKIAVGTGQLINMCNYLEFKDCEALHTQIIEESLSPGELVTIMLRRTRTNDEENGIVQEIRDLMTS